MNGRKQQTSAHKYTKNRLLKREKKEIPPETVIE